MCQAQRREVSSTCTVVFELSPEFAPQSGSCAQQRNASNEAEFVRLGSLHSGPGPGLLSLEVHKRKLAHDHTTFHVGGRRMAALSAFEIAKFSVATRSELLTPIHVT